MCECVYNTIIKEEEVIYLRGHWRTQEKLVGGRRVYVNTVFVHKIQKLKILNIKRYIILNWLFNTKCLSLKLLLYIQEH